MSENDLDTLDGLRAELIAVQDKLIERNQELFAARDRIISLTYKNWRPIETAPRDGTEVLIYEDGQIVVAYYQPNWVGNTCPWFGTYGDGYESWTPTHWMPLPPPPGILEGERDE